MRKALLLILILSTLFNLNNLVYGGNFTVLNAFWGLVDNPFEVGPGDKNVPLTLTLQYFGSTIATSIHATLILPKEFTDINGEGYAKAQINNIQPNSIFFLTFKINVDQKAKLGTYIFPLELKWNTTIVKFYSENTEVKVDLKGKVELNFETSQNYLNPGQINPIKLMVRNDGSGDAYDISINVNLPPQITLLNKLTTLDLLKASSSNLLELNLFVSNTLVNTPISITISSTYKDAYFNKRSITQVLGFIVKDVEKPSFYIKAKEKVLKIGEINDISLEISNTGSVEIKDITIFFNPSPPLNLMDGDGTFKLGNLLPTQTKALNLKLYISNTNSPVVSLPLTIKYIDTLNFERIENRFLNFFLSSEGSFQILDVGWGSLNNSYDASPGDINVPLVVRLQYFGNSNLDSLKANLILPTEFQDIKGSNVSSSHINNLPPNSIFQLTFYINIGEKAKRGIYQIPIILNWNTSVSKGMKEVKEIKIELKGRVKLSFLSYTKVLLPGKVNDVPIELKNYGSGDAYDISLSISLPPQVSLLNSLPRSFNLPSNSKVNFNLQIYLPPNTILSPLTLTFLASYKDPYGNSKSYTESLGFKIKDLPSYNIKITPSSYNLNSEEINDIKLLLKNLGNSTLRDLQIFINLASPLSLIDSEGKFFLDELKGGEVKELPLKIYIVPTSLQVASISLNLSYKDEVGSLRSENLLLSFLINLKPKTSPLSIKVEPDTLMAGKINNFTLTLYTSDTIKSVFISFSSPQMTLLEPESIQLDNLKVGEEFKFKAKVYVPSLTTASLQLNIKYYDKNNLLNQEVRNLGFLIKGLIDIKLTDYSIIPDNPSLGEPFSLVGTITNLGTTSASGVMVYFKGSEGITNLGSPSYFIGDLPVNALSTFTLTLQANQKEGIYQIPLEIHYMDNLREEHVKDLIFNVKVIEKMPTKAEVSTFNPFEFILPYLLSSGIAAFIGFLLGKRKK